MSLHWNASFHQATNGQLDHRCQLQYHVIRQDLLKHTGHKTFSIVLGLKKFEISSSLVMKFNYLGKKSKSVIIVEALGTMHVTREKMMDKEMNTICFQ